MIYFNILHPTKDRRFNAYSIYTDTETLELAFYADEAVLVGDNMFAVATYIELHSGQPVTKESAGETGRHMTNDKQSAFLREWELTGADRSAQQPLS